MAYGSGFLGNLPPWNPMGVQTPPPVANPTTAPGPITNYNAGQLRMLNHAEPAPMPAGGAARPPVSMQTPINSSVGQMTPRSAGLGGAVSPNDLSLAKFDKSLTGNGAFRPQATVGAPSLVEGMSNMPRSMPPLGGSSTSPSWINGYMANGGVLPPEPPKTAVNMSAMRGDPRSTIGYSMGGGSTPRSPGAPYAVPPSGASDIGGTMEEARNLSRTAGIIGGLARFGPVGAVTAISGPSVYREAMDPRSEFGGTLRGAGDAIGRETSIPGKVGATVAAAPFVIGTGIKAALRPFVNFANEAIGAGGKAYAAPSTPTAAAPPGTTPPSAPPPAAPPPAVQPPANPVGPRTVSVAPQGQSLSQLYPDRFKGVPTFGSVVNGATDSSRLPLSPAERAYNAEVMRGLQLENRARELSNVDRYRATQLHDRHALATLNAVNGGPGASGREIEREQMNPAAKDNKLQDMQDAAKMLNDKREAVRSALFDPNVADAAVKVQRARQADIDRRTFEQLMGIKEPSTFEEEVLSQYGMTYDPQTGKFKKQR